MFSVFRYPTLGELATALEHQGALFFQKNQRTAAKRVFKRVKALQEELHGTDSPEAEQAAAVLREILS